MLQQSHDKNRQQQYNTGPHRTQVSAFQFSVLTCRRNQLLTKIIYSDGIEKSYDHPKYFYYKYCELDSLDDFARIALTWLADKPNNCIIRGQLKPEFDVTQKQRRLIHPKDGDPATLECPPQRWIPLDLDGVSVPAGLGAPDKLAEAGYHIRDNILPSYFRGVPCIASATSSTGRKGPTIARLRLFFELTEAANNEGLRAWIEGLSEKYTFIDPKVMEAQQPIYTARPRFDGSNNNDPVPEWGRIRVLDGYTDTLEFEMPRGWKPKKHGVHGHDSNGGSWVPEKPQYVVPEELLEITAQDAGLGVPPLPEEISDKAWVAIRQVFDLLDGQPKGGMGRHEALNRGAWQLARLVAECELPASAAREAFLEGAKGIKNDGKYDAALIERHIDDAFDDVCRRP